VVERTQAVIERLLSLRAGGRLQSATVEAAAVSLGVDVRSVWRWLSDGEYAPGRRTGWQLTPAAIEAFYRTGGRPTAAWRLLRQEGEPVPSQPVFCAC
jgi:hypothetical protein